MVQRRPFLRALVPLLAALWLAACEGGGFDALDGFGTGGDRTFTVAAVIGPPDTVRQEVLNGLAQKATEADLSLATADNTAAEFSLTGYLAATADGGATQIAYVWDVFDAEKTRVHRVTGTVSAARAAADDPWSAVDPTIAGDIAGRVVTDLKTWRANNAPPAPALASEAPATPESEPSAPRDETTVATAPSSAPDARPADAAAATGSTDGATPDTPAPGFNLMRQLAVLRPAVEVPEPARSDVQITGVFGAPGDGSRALTLAIEQAMAVYDITVGHDTVAPLNLSADVTATPPVDNQQMVAIIWTLTRVDGTAIGTVRQINSLPAGAINNQWGSKALSAANAAAPGLAELVRENVGE